MGSDAPAISHGPVRPAVRRHWAALCTGAVRGACERPAALAVPSYLCVPVARDLNQASACAGGLKEG